MIETEKAAREYVEERCDDAAMERLEIVLRALREENDRQNLVAAASLDIAWIRHIADSAQLLDHVPRETRGRWLDLGSGAGFPGLVIAAMRPQWRVELVESRRRRVEWLERMLGELGLAHCVVHGKKLEQISGLDAAVISARAFAPLPKLLRLSARFSTEDTHWVLPKGRSASQEVDELPRRHRKMFHVEQSRTDAEAGIVVGRGQVEMRS